ncbi:MAG: outer membrane protein transport protein [Gammaproteobacteria bacterium]|nr:outer membrane protein transport protein [Gammaproteobacteria bacterium]
MIEGTVSRNIRIEQRLARSGAVVFLLVSLLTANVASGQEAATPLQFNFSDPGARSMGFGGAFVALADDATAAFANPAGLVQILKPELSLEVRHWRYATPYTEGGRVEGLPSGFGIDSTVGLRKATSNDDIAGLSFVSLVYPKDNWSVALYRHNAANFEFSSETQGLFGGGTDCCQQRDFDMRTTNDMNIVSYGIAAGYRVSDRFNLGLGVAYYDASFISNTTLFRTNDDTAASLFEANAYLPERTVLNERIGFDDFDTAFSAGFLWKLSDAWQIGGVYRQAPELNLDVELTAGASFSPDVAPGELLLRLDAKVELPEIYGLGIMYRDTDGHLTVSFQWDRINYSSIVDSLKLDDRAMDNVDELHLGMEYVFLGTTPVIALRFGAWLDPDHRMRNTSDRVFAEALLPRGDDQMHYTAGLGAAMQRFQVDFAVDFADELETISMSAIYNFDF